MCTTRHLFCALDPPTRQSGTLGRPVYHNWCYYTLIWTSLCDNRQEVAFVCGQPACYDRLLHRITIHTKDGFSQIIIEENFTCALAINGSWSLSMGIRSTASSTDVEKRMSLHRPVFSLGCILFIYFRRWNHGTRSGRCTSPLLCQLWQIGRRGHHAQGM